MEPTIILSGVAALVVGIGGWAWVHTHKRIDEKVSRVEFEQRAEYVDQRLAHVDGEHLTQRNNIAKIFDKLETMREDMHRQYTTLLTALHEQRRDK